MNATKSEMELRSENESLVFENRQLRNFFVDARRRFELEKLARDEAERKLRRERFTRRVYMAGFFAAAALSAASALALFR